ncbi:hypothetical protein Nepgr_028596 [Nepenthes gracilis]|uniref:2Fe-2S ferredoxin-type domain-containing protein n=1 Tax=Nepenthes gracilis TaxID=150966 RepID=A0AAD3TCM6_NEPGR|nr:hypothetical protein Nepgr_028596 [Nepenthes gracilis]
MRFFRRIAGILGLGKDDTHASKDEDDDADADETGHDQMNVEPIPGPRKGFSVPVQVAVERPSLGPVVVPCNAGNGGVQGLKWYAKRLRIDEDGDIADEFLDQIIPDVPSGIEEHPKLSPRFQVKYSARPAKVKDQALTPDGRFQHCIETRVTCRGKILCERERDREMQLRAPCSVCTALRKEPAVHRQFSLPYSFNHRLKSPPPRRKTTSQLQVPVEVTGSTGSPSASVPTHKVTVHDRERGITHEFVVPEDQYILHTAESQDIRLPFACRHGCCTSCAVRVKSGHIRQPEALGISPELKSKGYALLCVGFPSSDVEVETQDEDEVYWLQFGRYFARGPIERDEYALELAMGDE